MPRDASAYLRDIIEACESIESILVGVDLDEYVASREKRSAVEREFIIIGEQGIEQRGARWNRPVSSIAPAHT